MKWLRSRASKRPKRTCCSVTISAMVETNHVFVSTDHVKTFAADGGKIANEGLRFECSQIEVERAWCQVAGEAMARLTRMLTLGIVVRIVTASELLVANRSAKAVEVDGIPTLRKVR